MPSSRTIAITGAAFLLVAAAVTPLVLRRNHAASAQPAAETLPVVEVAQAELRPMERTLRVSGTLKSGSEASLSAKQGGKIMEVAVREGQVVRRGHVLVRLDLSDAQRQAEAAAAGVAAARAAWDKALQGLRLRRVEIERRITEARNGVAQAKLQVEKAEAGIRLQRRAAEADVARAQAGVDAAKSSLAQAKRGARPEERRQAQIQVQTAERGAELARKNLEDVEFLHSKGGLPRVQLDEARENYRKAQDGMQQARTQLALVEAGATPEEIAAAEAQVRSAEAALAAARTAANRQEVDSADLGAARGQLRQADEGLKAAIAGRAELQVAEADVSAAQAAYNQAVAGSRLAAQQVQAAAITSPIDGIATSVTARAGEMAAPGMPLVRVVSSSGVYLEAAVSGRQAASLQPGSPATVTVEALPGRTLDGRVTSIGQTAGPDGRSYAVRIDFTAPAAGLKPGGIARAEIVVEHHPAAVTVPSEAIRVSADRSEVWVVRDGRLTPFTVDTPIQKEGRTMVVGNVRAGDLVVLSNTSGLSAGDPVRVRE